MPPRSVDLELAQAARGLFLETAPPLAT